MESLNIQMAVNLWLCHFKYFCSFHVILYNPSVYLSLEVNLTATDHNLRHWICNTRVPTSAFRELQKIIKQQWIIQNQFIRELKEQFSPHPTSHQRNLQKLSSYKFKKLVKKKWTKLNLMRKKKQRSCSWEKMKVKPAVIVI